MNRNRFYYEIEQENRSKREAIIWSFFILLAFVGTIILILWMPTEKKIMAPVEKMQTELNLNLI